MFKLYIGSNNTTHKLEKSRAVDIASKYFDGFSVSQILGYWKGQAEKTLLIEIETNDKNKVTELCQNLKKELCQEAIGLIESIDKMEFIG